MSERLTASPSGRCVTEGPMLVAPREVLVCCVLPWSFPARVSCPRLRFLSHNRRSKSEIFSSISFEVPTAHEPRRRTTVCLGQLPCASLL